MIQNRAEAETLRLCFFVMLQEKGVIVWITTGA